MGNLLRKLLRNRRNENYNRGIALYNEGRFEEAIASLEEAIAEASESSTTYRLGVFYAAEAHANLGRSLLKAGHHEEACEHFRKALVETPSYPDLHYNLGVALFMGGKAAEALAPFEKALEINPDYVEARCFLAVAQHSLDATDSARKLLTEVTQRPSEIPIQVHPFLLVNLKEKQTVLPEVGPVLELLESSGEFREVYSEGIKQFNLGRFDLANDLLTRAAGMKPHYPDVQCQLGLARLRLGHLEEAESAFQGALAINPRFMEASYFLGLGLLQQQRYREAEESLEFARELEPEAADLLYHLALCKYRLGKMDEAEARLEEVLARRSEFPQAQYLKGLIRYADGDADSGIDLLKNALSDHPHLGTLEMDLGLMYFDRGEWQSAEAIFQGLAERDTGSAALHCFLGQSNLERGQLDAALRAYQRAMDLEPENLYALTGRLRCEVKLGRHAKAQSLIEPFLARHPEYPDLRKLQGDIHFRAGAFAVAESDYREALRLAPSYLEAQLGLALTLRNLARGEEAADLLRQLVERHPQQVGLHRLLSDTFLDLDLDA